MFFIYILVFIYLYIHTYLLKILFYLKIEKNLIFNILCDKKRIVK